MGEVTVYMHSDSLCSNSISTVLKVTQSKILWCYLVTPSIITQSSSIAHSNMYPSCYHSILLLLSITWYKTGNSSVFTVCTIMRSNCSVTAVNQPWFSPSASNIVQKYGTSSLAIVSWRPGDGTYSKKLVYRYILNTKKNSLPWFWYPSWPHTTLASGVPQLSSQTVPQALL